MHHRESLSHHLTEHSLQPYEDVQINHKAEISILHIDNPDMYRWEILG